MFTLSAIKEVIANNTVESKLFEEIYDKLSELPIKHFDVKKVGKTDIRYIHIPMDAFLGTEYTRGTDLGTSHVERYYFIEVDGQLVVVATETGCGYINRGHSAYFVSATPLYGDLVVLNKHAPIYNIDA